MNTPKISINTSKKTWIFCFDCYVHTDLKYMLTFSLTAGLWKVNHATLHRGISSWVTMGWKLLLYLGLVFSKYCYFKKISTHCGKICRTKAFHIVEHGWLLPYSGLFFKISLLQKNFVQQDENLSHAVLFFTYILHISNSLLAKREFQIQIVCPVIGLWNFPRI